MTAIKLLINKTANRLIQLLINKTGDELIDANRLIKLLTD